MSFLKKHDFNRASGWGAIILGSIGTSLLVFAGVYVAEGLGWLAAYEEEQLDLVKDVGWNWIRGGGLAFAAALILLIGAALILGRNRKLGPPARRSGLNNGQGLLGLVMLAVSAVFFFNGILYRTEAARWFYGGVASVQEWMLVEASAWITASTVMFLIGIGLSAGGLILLVIQAKKRS